MHPPSLPPSDTNKQTKAERTNERSSELTLHRSSQLSCLLVRPGGTPLAPRPIRPSFLPSFLPDRRNGRGGKGSTDRQTAHHAGAGLHGWVNKCGQAGRLLFGPFPSILFIYDLNQTSC
mmetsp:Transcript_32657/g.64746  ORF Transcript_32657/g.64746 Transcript_32657/m.64746 type:complete len:119 (+) Transcript_32657:590-946(+)